MQSVVMVDITVINHEEVSSRPDTSELTLKFVLNILRDSLIELGLVRSFWP